MFRDVSRRASAVDRELEGEMADLEVTFVDIGQGDATLVKLPDGQCLLVDVCRCPGEGIDLFKLLDEELPQGGDGRKRIEVLVVTHAHDDHIDGIGDLYDRYQVGELWLPQHAKKLQEAVGNYADFERVVEEHPEEMKPIVKGSRSVYRTFGDGGDVAVRCFSPPGYIDPAENIDEDEARRLVHENCMVLKISYAGYSVLLTGDSNKACWERVVGYYRGHADETGLEVLKAQALHASHHGSRTFVKDSKDDPDPYVEALELIDPEIVLISVGVDSKYDHPHDDMMEIYDGQVGAENVMQTSITGTIRLEVEADGTARIVTDDERYLGYAWDENGDGGGGSSRSVPPAAPPPGHYTKVQKAPRERYG
jgi:competence protein ComEC